MRIVSLVPSLTETLWDLGVGSQVVGVTKFCVHPPAAREAAAVVGGTKDPDVERIRLLRPDLVLADEDENKRDHLDAMAGFCQVHATRIGTVKDAARELARIGALVGREHDAEAKAQRILEHESQMRAVAATFPAFDVFVPIWRKPLMTMGGGTYMSDLLSVAGARNVYAGVTRKYFETTFDEVRAHAPAGVLLPTEPYRFRDPQRMEFAQALGLSVDRVLVCDGQVLTWFGTRTLGALDTVADAVRRLRQGAPAASEPQRL